MTATIDIPATLDTDSAAAQTPLAEAAPPRSNGRMDRNLVERFLAGEVDASELPEPNWGPIGRDVYLRTYSRDIYQREPGSGTVLRDADGQKLLVDYWRWPRPADSVRDTEVWAETVRRVVLGNTEYAPADTLLPGEAVELFELVYTFRATPAGRHLWVTGTGLPWTRNCWGAPWSARTSEHLRFAASRLFEGGGVGANYSDDLVGLTSPLLSTVDIHITIRAEHSDADAVRKAAGDAWVDPARAASVPGLTETIRVDDSREGWVDAWCRLIDLACADGAHDVLFDLSDVRAYGEPLRTFGGRASGPGPLAQALQEINAVLRQSRAKAVDAGLSPQRLTGIEFMEIDHSAACAIVAGGARRSARLSTMRWTDPDIFTFINVKQDSHSHWSTNISVEISDSFREALADPSHPDHEQASAVLKAVAEGMATNGEPGLIDADAHSVGEKTAIRTQNPCGEASLEIDPGDPENGHPAAGESCNLGSVNLAAFGTDFAGATRAFGLMARFLYRATLKPYPGEDAQRIEARNRRIGVGIMGLQGWMAAHGRKLSELASDEALRGELTAFRLVCRDSADRLADMLALPRPVKVTAVAPTGTIAQLCGCTPGIHPVFARYFIRRVRYAASDPQLPVLANEGYTIVDDVYAGNTKVVERPVRDAILDTYPEDLIEQSDELDARQFMGLVAAVQESFCGAGDGQAVSATGQIPAGSDPAELADAIRSVLGRVKGVTVFPDQSFELAPYTRVTAEEYQKALAELDESARFMASLAGDSNDGLCAGGACPVK